MSKERTTKVEMMVRGKDADQWEYLIGREIRMSEVSKRAAWAFVCVLAVFFTALSVWVLR